MAIFNLNKMFQPKTIAVVGASEKPGTVGCAVMRNLIESGFEGEIYPVNPRRKKIWDRHVYSSLGQVGAAVDLVVVAVPIALAPDLIRECTQIGAGGAVIISAGGKETGSQGQAIEAAIQKAKGNSDLRIIGPNCVGIVCSHSKLNASFASHMPLPGKMAFISQSGAICTSILDLSLREQIGFSYFISLGSMLDVDFGDMIDYLGADPGVSSIVMYVENLTHIRSFMSAARSVSRIKPIIALKAGRTQAGAKAAASHTGAIAGEDAVYDAAFKRAGILRVKTFEELFDCAELLAKQPRPRGPGLAIITNAGGLGVMAADTLADYGVNPVSLSPSTMERLNQVLPPYWSHGNPIDIIGDASPELFRKVVEICLDDSEVNGLLLMAAPQALSDPTRIASSLVDLLKKNTYPIFTAWVGGHDVEQSRNIFNAAGIPTFDTPERAVRAFMDLNQYSRNIQMLQEIPSKLPRTIEFDSQGAKKIVQTKLEGSKTLLTEVEAKELLAAYGIPVNPTEIATSAEEAVQKAQHLGFPVAMKIYSRDIAHKTEAKGVKLNLQNASDVSVSFQEIMASAHAYDPKAHIEGVTVQPMIKHPDFELILGAKKDPQFGPVVLFGMGGIITEAINDCALAFPPLNRLLARRLMEETKVYRLLKGFRNHPPANMLLLEEILIRLAQMVIDLPEIGELDINPLIVHQNQAVAVDARILLQPSLITSPSHLIISPYPRQYETQQVTKGGVDIFIRPIRPEDAPLLVDLFESLSSRSVYYRFFTPMKQLPHRMLARFTQIDYDREIALVAMHGSGADEKMLGVARVTLEWNQRDAEFAIVVSDPWQGQGIGAALFSQCLSIAKERRIQKINGIVLADNRQMLAMAKKFNFQIKRVPDASEYELSMNLSKF